MKSVGPNVTVKRLREPIDFDHPWFYVFFGTLVGFGTVGSVRLLPQLTYGTMRLISIGISIFVLAVGGFWMFSRPGVATYGRRVLAADLAFGALLICVGFLLGAHALFAM